MKTGREKQSWQAGRQLCRSAVLRSTVLYNQAEQLCTQRTIVNLLGNGRIHTKNDSKRMLLNEGVVFVNEERHRNADE